MTETLILTAKTGRPRNIPESAYGLVFQLHEGVHGFRRISSLLAEHGVSTTKSSVERCIKGQPPYQGRRVMA